METKICKVCGQELPVSAFRMTRWGTPAQTCQECIEEKRAQSRYDNAQMRGGGPRPFFDEAFDGKQPREVIELMSRAKRWLESRGYSITLKGTYTQVKEVKF